MPHPAAASKNKPVRIVNFFIKKLSYFSTVPAFILNLSHFSSWNSGGISVKAKKVCPAVRSLLFGIGRTNQLDTYLSPMEYTGLQVSFLTQSERMT
ncbi:MAG: hypothetical protein IKX82_01180, partial [Bacilli bacterium]|nr:hypothetical protein [Bacilli bacterium]